MIRTDTKEWDGLMNNCEIVTSTLLACSKCRKHEIALQDQLFNLFEKVIQFDTC
eukprot:m.28775 g.28775  ORF g.28775 m.28775 type:complete len:54 (+) comp14207_c0_seq5:747-908(+)